MSDPATRNRSRATADMVARTANVSRVAGGRHLAGENYAFCDGHVKWLSQTAVPPSDTRFTVH